MATCAHNLAQGNQPMHASPMQKTPARGKGLRVDKQPLFIPNQKTTRDLYKGTKPLRMNQGLSNQFSATFCLT